MKKSLVRKIEKKILHVINGIKLQKKFLILYFFCVIIPLILTDSIIIQSVYSREMNSVRYDMEYVASLYKATIENTVDYDKKLARSVELNARVNDFLSKDFNTPYEFFRNYFQIINGSFLETMTGLNSDHVTIYADNEGILDGEYFKRLSSAEGLHWYEEKKEDDYQGRLVIYYDDVVVGSSLTTRRKFKYIYEMLHFKNDARQIAVVDNNCSSLQREFEKLTSKYRVYLVCGDYVMFNTENNSMLHVNEIKMTDNFKYEETFTIENCELRIIMFRDESILGSVLQDYRVGIVFLIIFTILIPVVLLDLISKSIIGRMQTLEHAFGEDRGNVFHPIDYVDGTDEIAGLMRKYNKMAEFTNDLINTVYKERLRKQETDIAKKNAELLALQSQINPHFLFNALESIRMHSLLKGEEETAMMVGKLALMQRQNVEWGNDFVPIKKEMESIEAYLFLQSYRFGDRLSFDIDVDEECENYLVPKLTIVTFVENACVHGIESKASPGWIFVRVYRDDTELVLEIEDTGGGMAQDDVDSMLKNMRSVTIDTLKKKKHVGVLNACLRLKMLTDGAVKFAIDSEEGVGMSVEIRIPLEKLKTTEGLV